MAESKPKILIVDDTPANLYALNSILSSLEIEVFEAASGLEALSAVIEHDFLLY
jgi:CheY-like chemotaxis protein